MLHRNFKHDHFSSPLKGTVYSIVYKVGTTLPPFMLLRNFKHDHFFFPLKGTVYSTVSGQEQHYLHYAPQEF
jgi:hypothetical protein